MKVGAISFKGVQLIGSVPKNNSDFIQKKLEYIDKAEHLSTIFNDNGVDTFVVKCVDKDARGNGTNVSTTYLLTKDDAKIVNKYDEIKKDFMKLYEPQFFQSDIFVGYFDNMCAKIDKQKNLLAEFIATSKSPV